jgi:acetylornithine deacetylase/succinyl-diaminopimelate desuccinylase-like protein
MKTFIAAIAATLSLAAAAQAQTPKPDEVAFRALYKELVETNTTLSSGSCTLASERMAARLKAAGFQDSELTLFTAPGLPLDGGLVAVLPGRDPKAKAILLLAHVDVVEAKREDWTRDPFKLIEEDGYFYGRGTHDDKAQAAIWVDTLIRYRQEGFKPRRPIKVALTCGEEGGSVGAVRLNGAQWLADNRRDLIDAEFGLNEGAGGELDDQGRPVAHNVLAAEKAHRQFFLEVTNPGGHSSRPVPDNAIYSLARALDRVSHYEFPVRLIDANRAYFTRKAKIVGGQMGAAMTAIVANPDDKAADAILSADPGYHAMLRTTCVATLLDGGHANNALPQRAGANINCRIFPGESVETTQAALEAAIADPGVKITMVPPVRPLAAPPPLDPKIMEPATTLAAKYFPGVPVIPAMSTGATDGIFLEAIGIPTYGVPGIWGDPDGNGVHGLNERMEARSLYVGRDYLTDLVKAYAGGK